MDLYLARPFESRTDQDLPSQSELEQQVGLLASQLEKLRTAPPAEPYNSPALLSGRAAAVFLHLRVRVGDYKLDNSRVKAESQLAMAMQRAGFGGDGMIAVEVVDDDPIALRVGLWNVADIAYKQAVDDYSRKQAELKTVQTPPQSDDFAHQGKPVIVLEPVQQLSLDREAWKHSIAEGSGLFLVEPSLKASAAQIETAEGSIEALVRTEYLVDSEGTIVRKSFPEYRAEVEFSAQAADGTDLERSAPVTGTTREGLGLCKPGRTIWIGRGERI